MANPIDEKNMFINIHGQKKLKEVIGILHNYIRIDSIEWHIALDSFCLLHKEKTVMQSLEKLDEYISF